MRSIATFAAVLLMTSACSSDPTYLPALRSDPMATYSHPDLRVDARVQTGYGTGLLGKPTQPNVSTTYVREGGSPLDEIVADVLATAEQSGWVIESDPTPGVTTGLYWGGTKEMPEGLAGISIGSLPDGRSGEDEEADEVWISLRFVDRYPSESD